jgi:hypothetical protein
MNREELGSAFKEFLEELNYQPKIDKDGDVNFKLDNKFYYIQVNEKDPTYFKVCYPDFIEINSKTKYQSAVFAANIANRKTKNAKIVVYEDYIVAYSGSFISNFEDYKGIFSRGILVIKTAMRHFLDAMEIIEMSSMDGLKNVPNKD